MVTGVTSLLKNFRYSFHFQEYDLENNFKVGDKKYHVLNEFITSTPFEEKSSDHFKDVYKLKLVTNFDISLTSFLGGVMY